jgi:hypothetical protein
VDRAAEESFFLSFFFLGSAKEMGIRGRQAKYGPNPRLTKRNLKTISRRKEKVKVCLFPFHLFCLIK